MKRMNLRIKEAKEERKRMIRAKEGWVRLGQGGAHTYP